MKWKLLMIFMLLVSINLTAARKFLIETDKSISNVSLINSKIGETIKLLSLTNDKTSYVFEIDDINNAFLKFSNSLKIKLYSYSDKVETEWQPIEKEQEVPVKSLFQNRVRRNIELDDFLIKSFISNPITNFDNNLRGTSFFYTQDNINFGEPDNLSIAWKSNNQVLELKILDLSDLSGISELYSSKSFNDTVFKFKNLPECIKSNLNEKSKYCISVKVCDSVAGIVENKLIFHFSPFRFLNVGKNLVFVTDNKFEINWNAPLEETDVKIYDDENNVVYSAKSIQKSWSISESVKILFKYKKPYKIELSQGNKSIVKNFYILHSYQDYEKISN